MDFEKIAQAIEKSRPEIKDLLFSQEIGEFLQNLAEKNSLNEEMSLNMIDEVAYIILGLKERSTLKTSLPGIGVPDKAVVPIIQEISKKIFAELDRIESLPTSTPAPTQNEPELAKPEGPVVITKDNKDEALKNLNQRQPIAPVAPAPIASAVPAINAIHHDLPMVEKGEVVHSVPHVEPAPAVPPPAPVVSTPPATPVPTAQKVEEKPVTPAPIPAEPTHRYPGGKDPYREPLD